MKKFLLSLAIAVLAVFALTTKAKAADYGEFGKAFLKDGKIDAPDAVRIKINESDGANHQSANVYYYQSDTLVKLANEYELLGAEEFEKKYGYKVDTVHIQLDIRIDDSDWSYMEGWDDFNYAGSNLADWMCFKADFETFSGTKAGAYNYLFDLYYMAADESDWGIMKNIVKVKNGLRYFDVKDHTLAIRGRYIVRLIEKNADGEEEKLSIFSDWCSETSVGKKGNQKDLTAPERLEAPILSDMKFNPEHLNWDVFWTIPNQVYEAVVYYWAEKNAFEPVAITTQYRVNDGEWKDIAIGNAADIYGGFRGVNTGDATTEDKIEIRARFECRAESKKTSKWSNYVCNKEGYVQTEDPNKNDNGNGDGLGGLIDDLLPSGTPNLSDIKDKLQGLFKKSDCKLCGICPVQPLNICLFIWILVVLLVVIVIMILIRKAQKKKGKKNGKFLLAIVIAIIVWILILALFIWLCRNK